MQYKNNDKYNGRWKEDKKEGRGIVCNKDRCMRLC